MGKRRFTAEQARAALLSAGAEMITELGPSSVASVSLAEAIVRTGVPRPSAYRVFGDGVLRPQSAFQEQLLVEFLERGPSYDDRVTAETVRPHLDRVNASDDSMTPGALADELMELLAAWAGSAIGQMVDDLGVGVYLAANAMVRTAQEPSRVEGALKAYRIRLAARVEAVQRDLLDAFGLRLRSAWTEHDLAGAVLDVALGSVVAAKGGTDDLSIQIATTSLASCAMALFAVATEPDPRRVVSAEIMVGFGRSPSELRASHYA